MKKGKIIVIEGTDCSGKETQSKLLVEYLNGKGIATKRYSFPCYDSPTGKIIGGALLGKEGFMSPVFDEGASNVDPYCASLLYAMDRKYNIGKIEQELKNGVYVILDRYVDSNMAHQGMKLTGNEQKQMFNFLEKLEYDLLGLPKADFEVLLHMPVWAGTILKQNREEKPDQVESDLNYLIKSEDTYLKMAESRNIPVLECVDGERIKTIEEINKELTTLIDKYLCE